jgi:hypothetical protein
MTRNRALPFVKTLLVGLGLAAVSLIPFEPSPMDSPMNLMSSGSLSSRALLGLSVLGFAVPAHAQSSDPIVTSDSPEYCGVLMDRISGITRATSARPPNEAAVLSEEGERMCVHGQTRGGILRLRRALEIMRRGED